MEEKENQDSLNEMKTAWQVWKDTILVYWRNGEVKTNEDSEDWTSRLERGKGREEN